MRLVTIDLILSVVESARMGYRWDLGCSKQMIDFMSHVMFSDDQGVSSLCYLLHLIG